VQLAAPWIALVRNTDWGCSGKKMGMVVAGALLPHRVVVTTLMVEVRVRVRVCLGVAAPVTSVDYRSFWGQRGGDGTAEATGRWRATGGARGAKAGSREEDGRSRRDESLKEEEDRRRRMTGGRRRPQSRGLVR
jgi:hypothetical protein